MGQDEELITLAEAKVYFALDDLARERIRKRLRGKGYVERFGGALVYQMADVSAAVREDEAVQQERERRRQERAAAAAQREREQRVLARRRRQLKPVVTRPCPGCGAPIPARWMLDRCHACCRVSSESAA